MFILKFKNYDLSLSGNSIIRITGPKFGSLNNIYSVKIKSDDDNNQYISIVHDSNPALSSQIILTNIDCAIIQDFILFTCHDKRRTGEINFVDYIVPIFMNEDVINESNVFINENLDPEQLSFHTLELASSGGKIKTIIRKTNYQIVTLQEQKLTMYDLKTILNTINMKALLDENTSLKISNKGLINNNKSLTDDKEQSLDLNDYLLNAYNESMFYNPMIGNHRKLIFGYHPENGFIIKNDSIRLASNKIFFSLKNHGSEFYIMNDKDSKVFEIGMENNIILFQATFVENMLDNRMINLFIDIGAGNTIIITLPASASKLDKFEFFGDINSIPEIMELTGKILNVYDVYQD